jgi:hypothetical protein
MKKSTIGDFDFSGIHQIDLDSLQSFFHHGGGGHQPSPAPGGATFAPSTVPITILQIPP